MTESRPPSGEAEALAGLVSDAASGFARLVRGEVALAKAEARQTVSDLARGLVMLGIAALLALIGLHVLASAAAEGLHALGLARPWALLIVGGGLALLALILVALGLRSIRAAKPGRGIGRGLDGLRRDVALLKSIAGTERGAGEHDRN